MSQVQQQQIAEIVARVLAQAGGLATPACAPAQDQGQEIPIEISARHVHLDRASLDLLYGPGYELTQKRDLSQTGQFLSEERVKLVTAKGQIANVGILGPLRERNQVELSLTDARILGVKPPIRLSGDLDGAADCLIVGPQGVVTAKEAVIVAKAHVHMTAADAAQYGVADGEHVRIALGGERQITLDDVIIRVRPDYVLAVHIDYDEANAAHLSGGHILGRLIKNR